MSMLDSEDLRAACLALVRMSGVEVAADDWWFMPVVGLESISSSSSEGEICACMASVLLTIGNCFAFLSLDAMF
jgi:hypothetical protein